MNLIYLSYSLISQDQFYKIFNDNNVRIHEKSQRFIEKRFIQKGSNMVPFKEVLGRLSCDLSQERPLESPWVIRSSNQARRAGDNNDILSIASTYLKTSVLSSKSKRMNIDNIIEEHEIVMDRAKKIDDKLKEIGGDDVSAAKNEMIQKTIKQTPKPDIKPSVVENKKEIVPEKVKLEPRVSKEEATNQNLTIKDNSAEIDLLQKLLNNTDMLNQIIKLSQMMIDAKIDFRILEFVKRGINKEYDAETEHISVSAFHKYWKNLIKPEVGELDPMIEDKILHFVTTKDGDKVDKNKLITLIDFYQYYPVYVQRDRNFSKEMYFVMSSNTDGGYNWKEGIKKGDLDKLDANKELIYLLEYINDKLKEKYPKIANAFRLFDVDHKSEISKEEFSKGLKKLKIVMDENEIDLVFNYLDTNKDGILKYNQF